MPTGLWSIEVRRSLRPPFLNPQRLSPGAGERQRREETCKRSLQAFAWSEMLGGGVSTVWLNTPYTPLQTSIACRRLRAGPPRVCFGTTEQGHTCFEIRGALCPQQTRLDVSAIPYSLRMSSPLRERDSPRCLVRFEGLEARTHTPIYRFDTDPCRGH